MKLTVTFTAQGRMLEAAMFLPSNEIEHPVPGLLFEGSATGATKAMSEQLARNIANEGFVCLVLDHSFFGESEEAPLSWESPSKRAEDIKCAFQFLSEQGGVHPDRLVGVGISVGAEYLAQVVRDGSYCQGLVLVQGPMDDSENAIGHLDIPWTVIADDDLLSVVDKTVVWVRSLFDPGSQRWNPNSTDWSISDK